MAKQFCYTVEGQMGFPVDMLRHDQCWPVTEEDSRKIFWAVAGAKRARWQVSIRSIQAPTIARWASYCCEVGPVVMQIYGEDDDGHLG